ncbi:F-box/kelch-repeat protein At1g57790-like [Alnus glutinosa]|uniref:F-box/kelch-repeat protein At1g57790-like n=1 Tax=Alnus glutinosa TaxID=3517 RepID=UPI002D774C34|nr:F-box/kelch-repeat protein At1g57790-like [Alnus glutinosa]
MTMEEKKENLELQNWSGLPTELFESIISRLTLEDNVRASVVCKRWHSVAVSVRVVNQSPWLMYFPKKRKKNGTLCEFYDPSLRKTHSIELPELTGSRVCYTKDGWLLLYRPSCHHLCFFNPFTRQVIRLPSFQLNRNAAAFSCAPTSTSCMLLTVSYRGPQIALSTCHPGATEWLTVSYQHPLGSFFGIGIMNKFVFCNGLFYCLSYNDWLGVFDPLERTWNVLVLPPPKCAGKWLNNQWEGKYMTEHKGEILLICACSYEIPVMFKLDQASFVWEEMKSLDGVTLFASFLASHSRTNLSGLMTNSVYFPKVRFCGKNCTSYSFYDCRFYPCKECHDLGDRYPPENIWIEPPQDFSSFT